MMNNLVNSHVSAPVVRGILVEVGKNCSTYKMDLVTPSIYRIVMIASFPLCTMTSELCLIPSVHINYSFYKKIK
ncbi:hypothetical protein BCV71DRAFT_185124 [Rhizopus microsporus]|uniref:Uncharacterized protein n=1 Tax=Rhizopus microsporus TaxID=58291 RepID=A0A1X0RU10_RHIZD|nr:hypothetical protein BCV71DRAFT_185124 [Rhizopus microsporus]